MVQPPEKPPLASVRVDVFLNVSCIMATRSKASRACTDNHVHVNGEAAKPNRLVRVGDALRVRYPHGDRTFVIKALADRNLPKAEARLLYEETTPRPTLEELDLRRLLRNARVLRPAGAGRPTKRERRETDKLRDR